MSYKRSRKTRAQRRPSAEFGIHERSFICVSKETLERLSTFRLRCNLCKRWLPALAFYAQVDRPESKSTQDVIYLARYEVKAEGFKGRHTVVVCEDCAEGKI
jgi:hypothetical protein